MVSLILMQAIHIMTEELNLLVKTQDGWLVVQCSMNILTFGILYQEEQTIQMMVHLILIQMLHRKLRGAGGYH